MGNKDRTRMYCHPNFKKLMDIRRLEYGEANSIKFTEKVSRNPELLKGHITIKPYKKNDERKKLSRIPTLF